MMNKNVIHDWDTVSGRLRDRHHWFYRLFLVLLATAGIVYLLPKNISFRYEYEQGTPWPHSDLFAPFDLNVSLTDEEIEVYRNEVASGVFPYYKQVSDTPVMSLDPCWSRLDTALSELTAQGLNEWKARLEQSGIIRLEESDEMAASGDRFFLIRENVAYSTVFDSVGTMRQAVIELDSVLGSDPSRKLLLDCITQKLNYTIVFDSVKTAKSREEAMAQVDPLVESLAKGMLIISRGQVIDEVAERRLLALKNAYQEFSGEKGGAWLIIAGQFLLVGLCLLSLLIFLRMFFPKLLRSPSGQLFLFLLIMLDAWMISAVVNAEMLHVYLVPLSLVPLIIRAFFDTRLALFTHIIGVLIIAFMVPNPFEFVFLQTIAGSVLLFGTYNLRSRSQFFASAAVIFGSYALTYLGINLIQEGNLEGLHVSYYGYFAGNAILSLLAYPLIFLFERLFGYSSELSLLEFADPNNKLLKELNEKAPGTFQHSLQVANLAEDAIRLVGGQPLLVRAGAMYHDIGKMRMPQYFVENQFGGVNPHDGMSYEDSARIIIDHVTEGVRMAKQAGLPDDLIDFIRTHHGTNRVEYFYRLKQQTGEMTDEQAFRYPGPKPFSKETAVLMMADSVEAASRSLREYSSDSIDRLVEAIIDNQKDHGQFDQADVTMRDISRIKKLFKKKLMNIYHVRIEYPKSPGDKE